MTAAERARGLALRWGWPAWVGLPLLLGAWLAQATWLPPLRATADAATADAAQARRAALASARHLAKGHDTAPETAPAPAGAAWRNALPDRSERAQRLAALLAQATAQGLTWRRGEFRVEPLREAGLEAGLEAYGLNLPVSGDYPALRAFIASALDADAALALDGLRLQRPSPAAPTVEAELQFTLYSRAAVAAAPP